MLLTQSAGPVQDPLIHKTGLSHLLLSLELNFRLSALSFFSGNKRQKNDNGGVNPSLKPRDGLGIWLSLYKILGSLGSTTELRKLRP